MLLPTNDLTPKSKLVKPMLELLRRLKIEHEMVAIAASERVLEILLRPEQRPEVETSDTALAGVASARLWLPELDEVEARKPRLC